MTTRTVRTLPDRDLAAKFIAGMDPPFTLTVVKGARRSSEQNALQWRWMQEVAEQRGDVTPHEVQAECKLTIGVPILRAENEAFRVQYDATVKGLPYEAKLSIMLPPIEFPVTRLMTVKQKSAYLDAVHRHWTERGFLLTEPEAA